MVNVLFVCIGNSCRSQMAEGFARKYGSDVLHSSSAGLAPASFVQPQTIATMAAKNIDITDQSPKSIYGLNLNAFDVVVNMSGQLLPAGIPGKVFTWEVVDPMMQPPEVYIEVREKIEALVMQLIMDVRRTLRQRPAVTAKARDKEPGDTAVKGPVRTAVRENIPGKEPSQRFGFGRVRRRRD